MRLLRAEAGCTPYTDKERRLDGMVPGAMRGQGCLTVVVVLWIAAGCCLLLCYLLVRCLVLDYEVDKRVHIGLTRADVEHYLGSPHKTIRSADELPSDPDPRTKLPRRPIHGTISFHHLLQQPDYREIPLTGFLSPSSLLVYYNQRDIVEFVDVRSYW